MSEWKSPIEMWLDDWKMVMEDGAVKAVQNVGINVDKEELLKALEYDRDQYRKGFADGMFAKTLEIVRCKDCKWFCVVEDCPMCGVFGSEVPNGDFFCAYGEAKDES